MNSALQDEALSELKEAKQALQTAVSAAAAASKSAGERAEDRPQGGGKRLSRLCKRSSKGEGLEGACMQHPGYPAAAWLPCVECSRVTSSTQVAFLEYPIARHCEHQQGSHSMAPSIIIPALPTSQATSRVVITAHADLQVTQLRWQRRQGRAPSVRRGESWSFWRTQTRRAARHSSVQQTTQAPAPGDLLRPACASYTDAM